MYQEKSQFIHKYLSQLGIEVWELRQKNDEKSIIAFPVSFKQEIGFLIVDGTLEALREDQKSQLLLNAIFKAVGITIKEPFPLLQPDILKDCSLLIALGQNAQQLAMAYQSSHKKMMGIAHSLSQLLAKPTLKRQVWGEIRELYLKS